MQADVCCCLHASSDPDTAGPDNDDGLPAAWGGAGNLPSQRQRRAAAALPLKKKARRPRKHARLADLPATAAPAASDSERSSGWASHGPADHLSQVGSDLADWGRAVGGLL